jgi:hypothetical protein
LTKRLQVAGSQFVFQHLSLMFCGLDRVPMHDQALVPCIPLFRVQLEGAVSQAAQGLGHVLRDFQLVATDTAAISAARSASGVAARVSGM